MRATITCLLATMLLLAADISGTWKFDVTTDAGSGTPTFVLKQDGDKLSGSYSGALGESKVHGTVKGAAVLIEFETSAVGTVRYTGTLDGSGKAIKGTVDLGGQASGTFTGKKN